MGEAEKTGKLCWDKSPSVQETYFQVGLAWSLKERGQNFKSIKSFFFFFFSAPPWATLCWNNPGARAEFGCCYITAGRNTWEADPGQPCWLSHSGNLGHILLISIAWKCAWSGSSSPSTSAWWSPAHLSRSCPVGRVRQTLGCKGLPGKRDTVPCGWADNAGRLS